MDLAHAAPANDAMKMMMYDANKKSAGIAYVLWFLVGGLGGHRFYTGNTGSAVAMLLLSILSPFTLFISLVFVGIWLLVDLFLIPGLVRTKNNAIINAISV